MFCYVYIYGEHGIWFYRADQAWPILLHFIKIDVLECVLYNMFSNDISWTCGFPRVVIFLIKAQMIYAVFYLSVSFSSLWSAGLQKSLSMCSRCTTPFWRTRRLRSPPYLCAPPQAVTTIPLAQDPAVVHHIFCRCFSLSFTIRGSSACSVFDVVDKVLEEYRSCEIIYFSFWKQSINRYYLCTWPVFVMWNYSSRRKMCLSLKAFRVNENVGKQVSDMQSLPEMCCWCTFGYCTV